MTSLAAKVGAQLNVGATPNSSKSKANGDGGDQDFASLVHRLQAEDYQQTTTSTDQLHDRPSVGLPKTGLKRNTSEFQRQDKGQRTRSSSRSSSSSIPSGAKANETPETEQEQEGPTGQGPGKHEKTLWFGGMQRQASPLANGHDSMAAPKENGVSEEQAGDAEQGPIEYLSDTLGSAYQGIVKFVGVKGLNTAAIDTDDEPERQHDTHYKLGNALGLNGTRPQSAQMNGDKPSKPEPSEDDGPRIDPEERLTPRKDQKLLADEIGRIPESLRGVKDQDAPGPMQKIVLDPRISHIHYHTPRDDRGLMVGDGETLNVTPDGEDEVPPGQTPSVSRQNSDYDNSNNTGLAQSHWSTMADRPKSTRQNSSQKRFSAFRQDQSMSRRPSSDGEENPQEVAQKRWSALRSRVVPHKATSGDGPVPGPNKVSALAHTSIASVPVTTELFAGQLPVMMLKTWLDRDEEGHRAVPVLLGSLRFRVGDSVGLRAGRQTGKEMFKVECEYGDGAVKWVIYRELRDFLSLHAHYKAANFGTSVAGLRTSRRVEIPEFPKMSLPYLNKLQPDKKNVGKGDYAQASRDALQHYLVELIRAVIFRPESNRLCKFFELSALTLTLAPRGGFQGKAGFLKIPGSNASRRANQPGLTPTSWIHNRTPKWFVVRDSYFVATDGPETSELYDVFIIDADFAIERPKRAYRTGLDMVTPHNHRGKSHAEAVEKGEEADIDLDNPFNQEMIIASGEGAGPKGQTVQDVDGDPHSASQHTFYIINMQRRLKLVAKNARHMHQFIVSMERIASQCVWTGRNRFDSFAPLRVNVAAQWLVDGRDYFWNLSRAINMAKDRIYIHDWWISPELYLRRPGNERYRLDNLLKRKAEEGVKVFIIIYNEVSDKTTPVDSLYTKKTLSALHPNIMVQRSPSHFQTGTFYWSHHEKLCVIDETIAFMGGLDLCYGRWDTSQHVLTDEEFTDQTGPNAPVWRGKDYSNERVAEYSNLDKPFEDVFDRGKVPRMPWHDVGLQIVGQPARDLCRHFVQRWNLLIRTKNHKRKMPFLLPPADFTDRELLDLKLQGTCEVQICRSVGPWSMGTVTKIEHSIQNAYCKSIQMSEHFVYIENQFFITSTVVDGVTIENGIGDALVERIIRAHKEGTKWKACIVIPLLPGYTYPIDSNEASSVRLIMECQNRTICRGTHSIFSRLRKEGIDPDDYITFFSLRGWAKFKSGVLTTEQVYIHGKTMIVDDRLVLCGSANINERSQRGDRDSELLAVIRDTDMIDGTMAGKPFKVGRFAHTLRMRLMREHVGVDVDSIEEDQLMSREPLADADEIETWDPDHEQEEASQGDGVTKIKRRSNRARLAHTVGGAIKSVTKGMSENMHDRVLATADTVIHPIAVLKEGQFAMNQELEEGDASERQDFDTEGNTTKGFASSVVPTLEEKTIYERRPSATHANGKPLFDLIEEGEISPTSSSSPREAVVPGKVKEAETILDGTDEKQHGVPRVRGKPSEKELYGAPANATDDDDAPPNKDTERDDDDEEQRAAISARKTLRKHLSAKVGTHPWSMPTPTPKINPNRFHDPLDESFWSDMWVATAVHNTEIFRKVFRCIPDDLVTTWASYKAFANHAEKFNRTPENVSAPGQEEPPKVVHDGPGTHGAGGGGSGGGAVGQGKEDEGPKSPTVAGDGAPDPSASERTPSGPNDAWAQWEREEMETLLNEVRGHLVLYSTRFLEQEDTAGQFLFQSDRILPLPIYD